MFLHAFACLPNYMEISFQKSSFKYWNSLLYRRIITIFPLSLPLRIPLHSYACIHGSKWYGNNFEWHNKKKERSNLRNLTVILTHGSRFEWRVVVNMLNRQVNPRHMSLIILPSTHRRFLFTVPLIRLSAITRLSIYFCVG